MKTLKGALSVVAQQSAAYDGVWLVVRRTDHPHVAGDYFYGIRSADKHAWTDGESIAATFVCGRRVEADVRP